jgi:hypothetical protein
MPRGGRGRSVLMTAKFLAFVHGPFFKEIPNLRKEDVFSSLGESVNVPSSICKIHQHCCNILNVVHCADVQGRVTKRPVFNVIVPFFSH